MLSKMKIEAVFCVRFINFASCPVESFFLKDIIVCHCGTVFLNLEGFLLSCEFFKTPIF